MMREEDFNVELRYLSEEVRFYFAKATNAMGRLVRFNDIDSTLDLNEALRQLIGSLIATTRFKKEELEAIEEKLNGIDLNIYGGGGFGREYIKGEAGPQLRQVYNDLAWLIADKRIFRKGGLGPDVKELEEAL